MEIAYQDVLESNPRLKSLWVLACDRNSSDYPLDWKGKNQDFISGQVFDYLLANYNNIQSLVDLDSNGNIANRTEMFGKIQEIYKQ